MENTDYIPTWSKFTWTSWGFSSNCSPPSREEMFSEFGFNSKWKLASTLCIEDFLQHNEVFQNGMSGQSCNMDSYMTIVNYKALDRAIKILEEHYNPTKEEWGNVCNSWLLGINTQPPAKIVARYIKNKFDI
jgi:hypothetical protein